RLYAELGSYTAVARCLGVCEATATNAVHFERNCQSCNEPLERGLDGRFTRSAIDRLRQLFSKGLTHRDIQLLTGVSAGTLTRERRRYEEYLKERKLAPIPARNHGEAYSGNLVPKSSKREVEQLYLEGFGAKKITERTGVSHTVCLRIRAKLLRRLKRAGKCLPGCDLDGTRRVMRDHARHIPAETAARLRKMLLS